MGETLPPALSIEEAIPHFQRGAALLDVRSKPDYVELHVPGSVHVPADELSARIASMLPKEARLVLMTSDDQDVGNLAATLSQLGYADIAGYINGGINAWDAASLQVTSGDVQDINVMQLRDLLDDEASPLLVLDVREPWEFRMGRVPSAKLIPLSELPHRTDELDPEQPIAIICASGVRSLSAAAVLGRKGFKTMYNILGGTHAWVDSGFPTEHG